MKLVRNHRRIRSAVGAIEILEARCLLSATLESAIPNLSTTVGESPSLSLTSFLDDPSIPAGDTVVAIQTNLPAPDNFIPIELTNAATPNTVANFLQYITSGEYADTVIHRSVPGFIVQGGGFTSNGQQIKPSPSIASEASTEILHNTTGTIAMALTTGPNTATDNWFINLDNNDGTTSNPDLDNTSDNGPFTVFGKVIYTGMDTVNTIAELPIVNDTTSLAFSSLPVQKGTNGATVSSVAANNFVLINPVILPSSGVAYSVLSSNSSVATGSISGGTLTIDPLAGGSANVTVTATDMGGGTASSTFSVTVTGGPPAPTLAPTITKSTIPTQVVGGTPVHGTTLVNITNETSSTESGTVTLDLYASSDGAIDAQSVLVGSVTKKKLTIKAGKTVHVPVLSKLSPTALSTGSYTLLAQTTDPSSNLSTSSTGPAITVAAPFISLNETFKKLAVPSSVVSGTKTSAVASVKIINSGNITSVGPTTISLYASIDGTIADGTQINVITKPKLSIKAGKSVVVSIPLKTYPLVVDGTYTIIAQVTDPNSAKSSATFANTVQIAAAEIDLNAKSVSAPTSATLGKSIAAALNLSNDGNVIAQGKLDVLFELSSSSNGDNPVQVANLITHIALKPGVSRVLHFKVPLALGSPTGDQYLVAVIDPMNVFNDVNLGNNTAVSSLISIT